MFNFLISYFNLIMLVMWAVFFVVVVARVRRPHLLKNISYTWLVVVAISIHLLYGISATILQYVLYSKTEIGKVLISVALPQEVPFSPLFEWSRPLFSEGHGYFMYYALQHFFSSTIVLFLITAFFVGFFKVYAKYRPAFFKEGDIAIIAIAFLVSGYLGSIVLVPLTLAFALLIAIFRTGTSKAVSIDLPKVFLVMAPLALLFAIPLLALVGLYPLVKL